MGNQYSITLGDESARIMNDMKENGHKVSQVIDEAIKLLGRNALERLVANRRFREYAKREMGE